MDELLYGPYPLSGPEFARWCAYFAYKNELELKAQKDAESKAKR